MEYMLLVDGLNIILLFLIIQLNYWKILVDLRLCGAFYQLLFGIMGFGFLGIFFSTGWPGSMCLIGYILIFFIRNLAMILSVNSENQPSFSTTNPKNYDNFSNTSKTHHNPIYQLYPLSHCHHPWPYHHLQTYQQPQKYTTFLASQ